MAPELPARMDGAQALDMSFLELVGAIFVRSQLIEQHMREMILERLPDADEEKLQNTTFGGLRVKFKKQYPECEESEHPDWPDMSLASDLDDARGCRNSAGHGDYLAHLSTHELMHDYGVAAGLDRLTEKGMRKSLWVLDDALQKLIEFRSGIASKGST